MAKNKELWAVLKKPNWASLGEEDKTKLLAAFDALLAVNPTDTTKFREAVKAHEDTWGVFEDPEAWANSGLGLVTYEADEYYTSNDFLNPKDTVNFIKLHQEAAAQRVKLNLSNVTDQDVLLGVMQNNKDALREYLASHIAPTMAVGSGWDSKKPSKDNVLTDEALRDIQQDAVAHWVLMAVETVGLDVLNRLTDKINDEFDDEIKALPGFPREAHDLIEGERIWDLVEERVLARQKELSVQTAFSDYSKYFKNGLSDADVLRMAPLLMADEANFRTGLPNAGSTHNAHKGDLSTDDVNALRELLGERYLKLSVADRIQRGQSLDALFMADTKEAFVTELKKLYPAHAYIDQVVTPQFMKECKEQMASQMLSVVATDVKNKQLRVDRPEEDYEWLLKIASQSDTSFKNVLKKDNTTDASLRALFPGVNLADADAKNQAVQQVYAKVDALFTAENRAQIDEIRKLARIRAFELTVSSVAKLPPGSHKSLINAFSNMSVEAQEKLLPRNANDGERILNIRHLARARDISVLKHYMPDADEADFQAILDSSEQHQLSKQIHNPGIYKVLAARFPVELTPEQVDEINATLADKDWSDEASYIQMVAEIKDICGIAGVRDAEFNRAFGLADDGLTKNDPNGFAAEIHAHNKKYQALFNEYKNDGSTINKNFLGAMLALPLEHGSLPTSPHEFKRLQDQILNFADQKFFIDVCFSGGSRGLSETDSKQFKASLEKAITPTAFYEMQAAVLKQACTEYNPGDAIKAVNRVQKILGQMQQAQDKIDKHINSAKFVFDVKEIHINNLLIREQEKTAKPGESIREKYGALAKNCDANMNELRHEHARLKSLLDALPQTATDIVNHKTRAEARPEIEALKDKLQAQLDKIDQQLEVYAKIKERIEGPDGILDMVHRVKQQPYWCYNRSEITSGVVTREELSELAIQEGGTDPDVDRMGLDSHDPGAAAKFHLADSLGSSQVRYFDIVQKQEHTTDKTKTVTIESRFTYDTSKSVPTTATARGIHRENAGRINIDKFPTYQEGSPEDPTLLEKAKVDYAMVVATQLLATMDRPPSKDNPIRLRGKNEEQLKYIWTALVILGEKTPNMKFGPDAIRVVNDHIFNPKAQLGWGWSNFAKDSLHEKVFKKHSEKVDTAVDALKTQASERLNRTGTPKSEEQLKEASQRYRSTVSTNREERVKTHGVSPETEAEQARHPSPGTHS